MLRMYRTVLFGMNPRQNRSTNPVTPYLLGLIMTTRSILVRLCDLPACLDRVRRRSRSRLLQRLVTEGQQHMPIAPQQRHPLSSSDLGKIDAAKREAREEYHTSLRERTIGDFPQGFPCGAGTVGERPGFTNFRLRFTDADLLGNERHREWAEIQPVFRSRQPSSFEQTLVKGSAGERRQQAEYWQARRPARHHLCGAFCNSRRVPIHAEDKRCDRIDAAVRETLQ